MMGVSTTPTMHFDLANFIPKIDGLHSHSMPFSQKEIDVVIANMPSDKAAGPDGFNGLFLKRYWSIIASDFYQF